MLDCFFSADLGSILKEIRADGYSKLDTYRIPIGKQKCWRLQAQVEVAVYIWSPSFASKDDMERMEIDIKIAIVGAYM